MASQPEVTLRLRAAWRLLRAGATGRLPRGPALRGAAKLSCRAAGKLLRP